MERSWSAAYIIEEVQTPPHVVALQNQSADEVVFVCMPFGLLFSPSLGLSLLKAELAAQGISSSVRYFSIRFAELVGQAFYYGLSSDSTPSIQDLAGEWIFSASLWRENSAAKRIAFLIAFALERP